MIRPAGPEDAAIILQLVRELARFERAEDAVVATEADLIRDGWGPNPRFEALIAELDGEPVGFALWFHNYSTWEGRTGLYVEDLYVRETARGAGVGRALLIRLAQIAVERGCPRMDLSVLDWNPARLFYARLGFAHKEEWLPYRISGEALAELSRR